MSKRIKPLFSILMISLMALLAIGSLATARQIVLKVGESAELNIQFNDWEAQINDRVIADVDDSGMLTAKSVGMTKVFIASGSIYNEYEIIVSAPDSAPIFNNRSQVVNYIIDAAASFKPNATFKLDIPANISGDTRNKAISDMIHKEGDIATPFARSSNTRFLTLNQSNITHVTCSFEYGPSLGVYLAYQDKNIRLTNVQQVVYDRIDLIISMLELDYDDNDMSDYDKAKAVHDFLVLNGEYDSKSKGSYVKYPEAYDPFGILILGKGVCQSYAESFFLIMNRLGIACDYVAGRTGEAHAWNRIKIDGKWYNVDVTYDDPVPDKKGRISYKYFLITDEQLEKDHTWTDYTHKCTSERFMKEGITK